MNVVGTEYIKLSEPEKKVCREEYRLLPPQRAEIQKLVQTIWKNPELSWKEKKTCELEIAFLKKHGFTVTNPYCGMDTAYRAEFGHRSGTPAFAFCAELDALPKVGHACGHHLVSGSAIAAALIVKELLVKKNIPGKIVVFGCPAEESGGGKINLAERGALEGVDAVMMAHPFNESAALYDPGYAGIKTAKIKFTGTGGSGVARCANPKLVNPLDAQTLLYQAVALRRHYTPGNVAVIGVITEGGERSNVIPVSTTSVYTIRSQDLNELKKTAEMLHKMAKGAAMMTGAKLRFELSGRYEPTLPCYPLSDIYLEAAGALGMETRNGRGQLMFAATDFGNLSQLRPGVHVHFPAGIRDALHTAGFAAGANKEKAYEYMFITGSAMAFTAMKYIQDPKYRKIVNDTFRTMKAK